MSDPFRRLFLDMLEVVLKKDPTHDTQLELLRLATPGLDESASNNRAETKKLFRTLLTRVHPDKHPNESDRATRLCQDVKLFYEQCSLASPEPSGRKRRRKSGSLSKSTAFPLEFTSKDKWPHISYVVGDNNAETKRTKRTPAELSALVAYQCINARGAIAHEKIIERKYGSHHCVVNSSNALGVREVFEHLGGAKELSGAEEIKEEITRRGPVVSLSFEPNEALLNHNSTLRDQAEFLIIGWTQQPAGEVWIVAPFSESNWPPLNAHVSFGQFGIDDCCMAPISDLENITWENGPYFDMNMAGVDAGWRTGRKSMFLKVTKISEIEPLLKEIGTVSISPSHGAPRQEHRVCIRDINKKAHSRKGILKSIQWIENKWKINVDFL